MPRLAGLLAGILLFFALPARAQQPAARLRISLLTCGVGEELYASFGHAGLRVVDSAAGTDVVYNYGTFNGFEENFELKFMRGKLLYYLTVERFQDFMPTYVQEGRSVWEQQLNITSAQAQAIVGFLETNLLPQNRAYKYDFLYDNCATRLRDILPSVLGAAYEQGPVLTYGTCTTFRQTIDQYLADKHWERYGIDLLLGNPIDRCMDDRTAQYLPDNLRLSLAGATINGQPAAEDPVQLLPSRRPATPVGPNGPLFLNLGILVLAVVLGLVPRTRPAARSFARLLFVVTGLLGCLIVVMWSATDHQACRPNWNLLWSFPPNLIAAFFPFRKLRGYAVVAALGVIAAWCVHIAGIQALPLRESWPLMAALLWCYGMIYRQSRWSVFS